MDIICSVLFYFNSHSNSFQHRTEQCTDIPTRRNNDAYHVFITSILEWRLVTHNPLRADFLRQNIPQRTRDVMITSLLRQNDVGTFWRNNDVIIMYIITSCVHWDLYISIILQYRDHACLCNDLILPRERPGHVLRTQSIWWLLMAGDAMSQGINSHNIGPVLPEYSGLITIWVELSEPSIWSFTHTPQVSFDSFQQSTIRVCVFRYSNSHTLMQQSNDWPFYAGH